MIQRPSAVRLTLCQVVIVEEQTRNVTPVNGFSRLAVEKLPSDPHEFIVFAILTDGLGPMTLK